MKNIDTTSYLIFASHLGFFRTTTKRYKRDAMLIKEHYGDSNCTPSFHLLSSLAFELFPKLLLGYKICVKHKNDWNTTENKMIAEIRAEMKRYNHRIDDLYFCFPELIKFLKIIKINPVSKKGFLGYKIILEDDRCFHIKDIEGIRYGSFAREQDLWTPCYSDNTLIDFLDQIEKYVDKKEQETNVQLKS